MDLNIKSIKSNNNFIFIYFIGIASVIIFIIAYFPSRNITFRVEHWDIAYFYSTYNFNPLSINDWIKIAFWTPFNDFRFIPLAYISNFLIFKLLGTNNLYYWILSVSLTIFNSLLLAIFVSKLKGDINITTGLIAASLFLLFPAKLEITIWTFFIYKLIHTSFILLSLIWLEDFLKQQELKYAVFSLISIVISFLFYEASLLIPIAILLRITILKAPIKKQNKIKMSCIIVILYIFYLILYKIVSSYMLESGGMIKTHYDIKIFNLLLSSLYSSMKWLCHGVLLANSGLSLDFYIKEYWIFFSVSFNKLSPLILIIIWGSILIFYKPGFFPKRIALYLIFIFFLGSIPVLFGRTHTNGPHYLYRFSMYHYFPSMILAALFGCSIDEIFRDDINIYKKCILRVSFFFLILFLGYANYNSIKSYMKLNEPVLNLINVIDKTIKKEPTIKIYTDNIKLPCTPGPWDSAVHAYHALYLLYPNNILLKKRY